MDRSRAKLILAIALTLSLAFSGVSQDRRAAAESALRAGDALSQLATKEGSREAIRKYEEAAAILGEIGDPDGQAIALGLAGVAYLDLGEAQQALGSFERSLILARQAGDRTLEASSLMRMSIACDRLGDQPKQLEHSREALKIAVEIKDKALEADALQNLGAAYYRAADHESAMRSYKSALDIYRSQKDPKQEAVALVNLGAVYRGLGMVEEAIDNYEAALPIVRALRNERYAATILNNIGEAYLATGYYLEARDNLRDALALHRKSGNRHAESITLSGLSTASLELGETANALEYAESELSIARQLGARRNEGAALNQIGNVYLRMADPATAERFYRQALVIRRAVIDRRGEVNSIHGIAVVQHDRGDLIEANATIGQAIAIVESLRASILSRQHRQSFFAASQEVYAEQVAILMDLNDKYPGHGYDGMALQASETAKARGLVDCLAEANAGVGKHLPSELLERRRTLLNELAKAEDSASVVEDENEIIAIQKDLRDITVRIGELDTEIKRRDPRYATLVNPRSPDLAAIQRQLDTNTALLEYSLAGSQAFLWIVSNNSINSVRLGLSDDIKQKARAFYKVASSPQPTANVDLAAKELGDLLLGPAMHLLTNRRLLIVPDGVLAYVPFAALRTTGFLQPMVVDHEIVNLPSAAALIEIRKPRNGTRTPPQTVAVLADPVFESGDKRVKRAPLPIPPDPELEGLVRRTFRDVRKDYTLKRLPGSRDEAAAISMLVPSGQRKVLLDFDANLSAATAPDLANYRYIHFSTHGISNSLHPELSGIVLSLVDRNGRPREGFLRLGEIYDLDLNADLVVLSACETAIGKEVRGEGLIALTSGFMHAGSRRVAATLWSVSDQATFGLMRRFYQRMLGPRRLRPAAALREAQIEMSKSPMYKAPFYWAAFTIQGEWK